MWWGVPPGPCCLPRSVRWETWVPPCSAAVRGEPAPSLSRKPCAWRTRRPSVCQGPLPQARPPFPFRDTPSRSNAVPASCLPLTGTRPRPTLSEEGLLSQAELPWFCAALGREHQPRKPRPPRSEWLPGDPPTSGQLQSPHTGGDRVVFMIFTLRKFSNIKDRQ